MGFNNNKNINCIGVAWKNDKGECGDPFGAN